MFKKVFYVLVLLGAACALWLYPDNATASGGVVEPTPGATITPTSPPDICVVTTGNDNGRVNLRACGSTSCESIGVLASNQILTVIIPGAWLKIRTGENQTGYINSKLCEVKE